ncbi:hypothetical protein SeLEV6574_g03368 [Synchytrium endobioticum]|uniref:Histone H1 n=1 Tax=Synchytrium endobioticum TaxID=286115 RepID=A0A507D4C6_9FUNG|nr:hypothetical protein SeLEV6574_g03368 [Synchytrium endobioticum]
MVSSKKHVAVPPPLKKMVEEAIIALNERNGSSRQVVKKYVLANYTIKNDATTISNMNAAIRKGVGEGVFAQPKGSSGPIKLVTSVRPSSVASKKKASSTKNVKTSAISTKAAAVSENTPVVIEVDTSESVAGKKSASQPRSTESTKTLKHTPKKVCNLFPPDVFIAALKSSWVFALHSHSPIVLFTHVGGRKEGSCGMSVFGHLPFGPPLPVIDAINIECLYESETDLTGFCEVNNSWSGTGFGYTGAVDYMIGSSGSRDTADNLDSFFLVVQAKTEWPKSALPQVLAEAGCLLNKRLAAGKHTPVFAVLTNAQFFRFFAIDTDSIVYCSGAPMVLAAGPDGSWSTSTSLVDILRWFRWFITCMASISPRASGVDMTQTMERALADMRDCLGKK